MCKHVFIWRGEDGIKIELAPPEAEPDYPLTDGLEVCCAYLGEERAD